MGMFNGKFVLNHTQCPKCGKLVHEDIFCNCVGEANTHTCKVCEKQFLFFRDESDAGVYIRLCPECLEIAWKMFGTLQPTQSCDPSFYIAGQIDTGCDPGFYITEKTV